MAADLKLTRRLKSFSVEAGAFARATPCASQAVLEVLEPRIRLRCLKSPSTAPDSLGEGTAAARSLTGDRPDRKRKGRGVSPPRPTGRVPRDSQNHKFPAPAGRVPAGATCVFRDPLHGPRPTQGRHRPHWPAPPRGSDSASSLAYPPSGGAPPCLDTTPLPCWTATARDRPRAPSARP